MTLSFEELKDDLLNLVSTMSVKSYGRVIVKDFDRQVNNGVDMETAYKNVQIEICDAINAEIEEDEENNRHSTETDRKRNDNFVQDNKEWENSCGIDISSIIK